MLFALAIRCWSRGGIWSSTGRGERLRRKSSGGNSGGSVWRCRAARARIVALAVELRVGERAGARRAALRVAQRVRLRAEALASRAAAARRCARVSPSDDCERELVAIAHCAARRQSLCRLRALRRATAAAAVSVRNDG